MGLATAGWKGRGGPLPDLEAEGGIGRAAIYSGRAGSSDQGGDV